MSKLSLPSYFLNSPLNIHFAGPATIPEVHPLPKTRSAKVMMIAEEQEVRFKKVAEIHTLLSINSFFQERHLQAALSQSDSSIPTPNVTEVDEAIYKNLYKAGNRTMPKRRVFTTCEMCAGFELYNLFKVSVLVDESDAACDYDCDTDDLSWLEIWSKEHPKSTLSMEKFEMAMYFLEKRFLTKVPTLEMLTEKKIAKRLESEAIYDYWQEKLLKNGGPLIPQLKRRLEKPGSYDPYVAFRSWFPEQPVKTRKNKATDRSNYVKLLKIRAWLKNDLHDLKQKKSNDIQAQKTLVYKLQEFNAQYKSHCFNDEFLRWTNWPQTDAEAGLFAKKPAVRTEESSDDEELKSLTEVEFPFNPISGSDYLMPVEPNIMDDDRGFFQISPCNFIRRRFGRGGRVVIDRKVGKGNRTKDTFRNVKISPSVHCSKFRFMPEQGNSCSVIKIQDTGCDENIDYNTVCFKVA